MNHRKLRSIVTFSTIGKSVLMRIYIGCKFLHLESDECRFDNCKNQLCQFLHTEVSEDNLECDEECSDNSYELNENQSHLCRKQLMTKDEHIDHVRTEHVVYYQRMLDVAAGMCK